MNRTLFAGPDFEWIDLSSPSTEELDKLAEKYDLHPIFVKECLDPIHLPKFERSQHTTFIIIRIFDKNSSEVAATVRQLTRKIALFITANRVISVHRLESDYFKSIFDETVKVAEDEDGPLTLSLLLSTFLSRVLNTYQAPLELAEKKMDDFESVLFEREAEVKFFQEIHTVRQRLSLVKRLLIHTQDVVQKFSTTAEFLSPSAQNLRETVTHYMFFADELLEDLTNLMNIQISLASQKTNEVMRLLTVLSVFFMPLTFIVGVYGMNFKFMPELEWKYGYESAWLLMIVVSIGIGFWVYRRGWLK